MLGYSPIPMALHTALVPKYETTLIVYGSIVALNGLAWLLFPKAGLETCAATLGMCDRDFAAQGDLTKNWWLRLFSLAMIVLGAYSVDAGVRSQRWFAQRSVHGRWFLFAVLLLLRPPRGLMLLGLSDFLSALWTWCALKRESN